MKSLSQHLNESLNEIKGNMPLTPDVLKKIISVLTRIQKERYDGSQECSIGVGQIPGLIYIYDDRGIMSDKHLKLLKDTFKSLDDEWVQDGKAYGSSVKVYKFYPKYKYGEWDSKSTPVRGSRYYPDPVWSFPEFKLAYDGSATYNAGWTHQAKKSKLI